MRDALFEGDRIQRIGVVVPVHDEEATLGSSLEALIAASCRVEVPVTVLVVLDACSDRSAEVAARYGSAVGAIEVAGQSVGMARAAGMNEVVRRHGLRGTWLATTDADSIVPPNWLAGQQLHAEGEEGASVVAGTICVQDWADYSDVVRDRAERAYERGDHRHVHGANLSFSAVAYHAAGGFRPLTCHEDVELVTAFAANGETIAWATDIPVATSARRQGRAPQGFADYLRLLENQALAESDVAGMPRAG